MDVEDLTHNELMKVSAVTCEERKEGGGTAQLI